MSSSSDTASIPGACPVCAGVVTFQGTLVATEIVVCPDCQSMLVVESLRGGVPVFGEAPKVEEDWGE
jgi:lysine biosynthesis protein LysW